FEQARLQHLTAAVVGGKPVPLAGCLELVAPELTEHGRQTTCELLPHLGGHPRPGGTPGLQPDPEGSAQVAEPLLREKLEHGSHRGRSRMPPGFTERVVVECHVSRERY